MENRNIDIDILLIGKTGAGKSSFINYVFGKEIAEVGNSKPVTQEFKTYSKEENKLKINITDSKGLEVQDFEIIKTKIIEMIERKKSEVLIVFYCVNLLNARVEDKELELLNTISLKIGQPIYILLTNCDSPDDEEIKKRIIKMTSFFEEKLGKESKIFPICNIDIQKRTGIVEKYGKEEVLKELFLLYFKNRTIKIAKIYSVEIINKIFEIYNILEEDKELFTLFSMAILFKNKISIESINKQIRKKIEDLKENEYQINLELKKHLEQFNFYYNKNKKMKEFSIINEMLLKIEDKTLIFPTILRKAFTNQEIDTSEISEFMKEISDSSNKKVLNKKLGTPLINQNILTLEFFQSLNILIKEDIEKELLNKNTKKSDNFIEETLLSIIIKKLGDY